MHFNQQAVSGAFPNWEHILSYYIRIIITPIFRYSDFDFAMWRSLGLVLCLACPLPMSRGEHDQFRMANFKKITLISKFVHFLTQT